MIRHSIVLLLVYLSLTSGQLMESNSSGGNQSTGGGNQTGYDKLTTSNSAFLVLDYQAGWALGI